MAECDDLIQMFKKAITANRYTLSEVFKACDTSGTGVMSKVEFCKGMQLLVPDITNDRLSELFWAVDADHTYKISYNQFVEKFRLGKPTGVGELEDLEDRTEHILTLVKESGDTLVDVFKAFDVTESNFISKKELKAGLEKLGIGGPLGIPEVDLVAVMGRMDVTGDRRIHYSEFVKKKRDDGSATLAGEVTEISRLRLLTDVIKKTILQHRYHLSEVFKAIDHSGTGLLSKQEFADGMSKLVPQATKEDVHELFLSADVDHTYKISYSQFVDQFRLHKKDRTEYTQEQQDEQAHFLLDKMHKSGDDLVQVFKQFDITESNFISKKELKIGLENLGVCGPLGVSEADLSALMGLLDKTGNGLIGYTEFVKPASLSNRRRGQTKGSMDVPKDEGWIQDAIDQVKARIILYGYSMKDVFDSFDSNGTGKLSKIEFRDGLDLLVPDLNLNEEQYDQLFRMVDSIRTYRVDFAQFVQHFRVKPPEDRRESARGAFQRNVESMINTMMESATDRAELFRRFDKSNTGYISKRELKEGLEQLGLGGPLGVARASCSRIMKILDRRGHGYITKEDIMSHQ